MTAVSPDTVSDHRPAMTEPARQPNRKLVTLAVMVTMFMISIESTIVSTAMPQIAAQLGGLQLYSWVFSAFLLAQTATTLIFGKLADMFGRKPTLLAGVAIFLIGSALCGLAWSMPSLVGFRLVQGVGAGAVMPTALTVVGDLYPGRERGRVQGWFSSVWGVSSVLGPLAGGLITQDFSWSWIFWINLPVGVAAMALFGLFLHERVARSEQHVDALGAGLFAAAVAGGMVALTEIGDSTADAAWAALVGAVAAGLFVWHERRARDPMVAFELWARRPIAVANSTMLLSGMAVIGLTAFLPMYVQGVLERSALVAGFTLTAVTFGWPIGSVIASRAFVRFGLRATFVAGCAFLPIGAVMILLLRPTASPVLAGCGSAVMGLGMGFLSVTAIVIVQTSVGWAERASATASNVFARNLGSTFGATLLGGVLNASLARQAGSGVPVGYDQIRTLLAQPDGTLGDRLVQAALGHSLHLTFWAVFAISVGTFAVATLVPTVALTQERPAE